MKYKLIISKNKVEISGELLERLERITSGIDRDDEYDHGYEEGMITPEIIAEMVGDFDHAPLVKPTEKFRLLEYEREIEYRKWAAKNKFDISELLFWTILTETNDDHRTDYQVCDYEIILSPDGMETTFTCTELVEMSLAGGFSFPEMLTFKRD
jgi:hypothetical protein